MQEEAAGLFLLFCQMGFLNLPAENPHLWARNCYRAAVSTFFSLTATSQTATALHNNENT